MQSRVHSPRKAAQIYAATLELLGEVGFEGLTIDAVAVRAGVNKTTVYRSWPSKDALAARAITESDLLDFPIPDTGSLRGDLEALAWAINSLLVDGPGRGIARALLAAPNQAATREVAERFFADRLGREQPIFERARARGELDEDIGAERLMDLLAGALWFRLLVRDVGADRDDIRALVHAIVAGVGGHTGC